MSRRSREVRIDLWYGIIAGMIVVVGFARAIFAAKGWNYYEHNVFFWAKISTFVFVALLSIYRRSNTCAGNAPARCQANLKLRSYVSFSGRKWRSLPCSQYLQPRWQGATAK